MTIIPQASKYFGDYLVYSMFFSYLCIVDTVAIFY